MKQSGRAWSNLVGTSFEAFEDIGPEGIAYCDVGCIAAPGDKHAADPRDVISRIERMPCAAEINFEPTGKVHGSVRRGRADIAKVAGAIARGDVHAAAKRDGKVRIVAADADTFIKGFPGGPRGSGLVIIKCDMVMNEVTDALNKLPAGRQMSK